MKKILILGFAKLAYMPYVNFYLEALRDEEVEIHIVSWLRDNEPDIALSDQRIIVHEFQYAQADEAVKASKVGSFLKYRAFAKQILKQELFDRIIVLQTFPAVLVADILLFRYHCKYILDYRDYSYEGYFPFKWMIGILTKASVATFVSSDAFRAVLPKADQIHTSHNLLVDSIQHRDVRSSLSREHYPIRIAFWGFIRHESINVEIINKLGNDERFELHYYGREQQTAERLKALVSAKAYYNIFFHGSYQPTDRYAFAANTDLLHNIYDNDAGTQKAMGNKYYDGIVLKLPQLCNIDSFMGQRAKNEGTGIMLDPHSAGFEEQILNYYATINWKRFEDDCRKATDSVVVEYEVGQSIVRQLLR